MFGLKTRKVNGKRRHNTGGGSLTGSKNTRRGSSRTPAQKRASNARRKSR